VLFTRIFFFKKKNNTKILYVPRHIVLGIKIPDIDTSGTLGNS